MNYLGLLAKLGEAERFIQCVLEKLLGVTRMFGRLAGFFFELYSL